VVVPALGICRGSGSSGSSYEWVKDTDVFTLCVYIQVTIVAHRTEPTPTTTVIISTMMMITIILIAIITTTNIINMITTSPDWHAVISEIEVFQTRHWLGSHSSGG
jgi:hypothetical protein